MPGTYDNRKADLIFPVISDVHIRRTGTRDLEKFARALQQLNQLAPEQNALAVVGDLTDFGTNQEYNRFFDVLNREKLPGAAALLSMGNHEYYSSLTSRMAQGRFLRKTGLPSLYYHRIIQGYHFLILSPENRKVHGYLSPEQIEWLGDRLKEAATDSPGKPIFVFHHQPIRHTVYGSETWSSQTFEDDLYRTLKPYPQVVIFSGHSHYPLDHPRSIHQQDFTSVGTSSVSYMELESGKLQGNLPEGCRDVSQGLLVEVYGGEVVIRRRSFHANRWVGKAWTIPFPSGDRPFPYSDGIQREREALPAFPLGARAVVVRNLAKACGLTVEFPQAEGDFIHAYQITAVDAGSGGSVSFSAFSGFYRPQIPSSLSLSIPGLKPGRRYQLSIAAIDAFGRESSTRLTTEGRTIPGADIRRGLTAWFHKQKGASKRGTADPKENYS